MGDSLERLGASRKQPLEVQVFEVKRGCRIALWKFWQLQRQVEDPSTGQFYYYNQAIALNNVESVESVESVELR